MVLSEIMLLSESESPSIRSIGKKNEETQQLQNAVLYKQKQTQKLLNSRFQVQDIFHEWSITYAQKGFTK